MPGKEPFTTELDELIAIRQALEGGALGDIDTNVDTLLARLTAARAGYLDNLSGGAAALAATALSTTTWTAARAGYLDILNRATSCLDFWSASQEEVYVTDVAGDKALPSVTISLPAGVTLVRVIPMFKFRAVENIYAGVNKLDGAQYLQVRSDAPGAWANALGFVDDEFTLSSEAREGGDVFIGDTDIKATVSGDDTYNFQWDEAVADEDGIKFNDVQTGLRVYFR